MTSNISQESATIYKFPARVRKTGDSHRDDSSPAADLASPRVSAAAFGSGWYHEAAIQESKRIRER
jgi:hypothetical protein